MLSKLVLVLMLFSAQQNVMPEIAVTPPLAKHSISLEERHINPRVNEVFRDNILLTLNYMSGTIKSADQISWEEVEKPFQFEFTLESGQTFAFHDKLLPEYSKGVIRTTNAHFNYQDGFKSDGYLMGDGVCHLASLIYWTARDAGLKSTAPSNHNFAVIPGIPREYGVSIYVYPGQEITSARKNLYITNDRENPIRFIFDYNDNILTAAIVETR